VKQAIDVAPFGELADPWVALAAVACATSSLRIGPLVTPLSRRRVHKLARETVTLDLAGYWAGEFEPVPVQKPRIPVWVAAEWPHRRPVRRA
jgi:Luciferase-like monooxygenase